MARREPVHQSTPPSSLNQGTSTKQHNSKHVSSPAVVLQGNKKENQGNGKQSWADLCQAKKKKKQLKTLAWGKTARACLAPQPSVQTHEMDLLHPVHVLPGCFYSQAYYLGNLDVGLFIHRNYGEMWSLNPLEEPFEKHVAVFTQELAAFFVVLVGV